MHILITGGAGFIGTNLAEYHLSQGHQIHVVDDLSTGVAENIKPFMGNSKFHFDHDDILSWSGLEKAAGEVREWKVRTGGSGVWDAPPLMLKATLDDGLGQGLEVIRVDVERNLLLIKGALPGAPGGDVIVRLAVKA